MTFMLGLESLSRQDEEHRRRAVGAASNAQARHRSRPERLPKACRSYRPSATLEKVSAQLDDALSKPSGADPFDLVSPPR